MSNEKKTPGGHIVRAYTAYSRFVAILAIVLPTTLWLSSKFGGCELRGSLSAYYHAEGFQGDVFVGVLSAVAVFLMLYKGWHEAEGKILNVAGLAALVVAFVPTSYEAYECAAAGIVAKNLASKPEGFFSWHGGAALVLFGCIFAVGVVMPWLRNKDLDVEDRLPGRRYYYCSGAVMLLGATFAVLGKTAFKGSGLFFWGEFLLVVGFGWFWALRSLHLARTKDAKLRGFLLEDYETEPAQSE